MQSPTPGPAVVAGDRPAGPSGLGGPLFALAVLFSMNLLNYVDRYSFFAVGKQIQEELGVSDTRYGYLSASFMIVYTLVSPFMGFLGDRYNRRLLLAAGVGLWSVATVGTAFSTGFVDMFFWRALLGVGEATYGVIAPALLADLFAPKDRGRAMGVYFLALPLGGALGYGVGGWVAQHFSWRAAFWVVGLPGLVAAFLGLVLYDPGRGASEGRVQGLAQRPKLEDYLALFRTPTFVFNTLGMAAVTFVTGAYAAWGSIFYQRVRGMSPASAGSIIGGMTALAGLIGIAAGTGLADAMLRRTRRAYLLMAALAVFGAVVPGLLALVDPELKSSLTLLFVAMIPMAMVLGPCNTVTASVVPSNRRAAGFAVSIFLIHLLGDISSPAFIGWVSDRLGDAGVVASPLGQALASFGAKPVDGSNLTGGMLSVVPIMGLGAVFFLLGSRHLPEDQDRARAAGGGEVADVVYH